MAHSQENENLDFISSMPAPCIHHMLSFLPNNKDRARTCVLSKRWRDLYDSRPNMVFHEQDFIPNDSCVSSSKSRRLFMNYVNRSVDHFIEINSSYLQRFELKLSISDLEGGHELQSYDLNMWLKNVCGLGVKTMSLALRDFGNNHKNLVLESHTLVQVHLDCLNFINACRKICLPNAKSLSLFHVDLSEDSLRKLVSACPKVEVLRLGHACTSQKLQLSGFTKLVELELCACKDVEMVEICSPNFQTFSHSLGNEGPCSIELIGSYGKVRKLELNTWISTNISSFECLEELTLTCLIIMDMISSQTLKRLFIKSCAVSPEVLEIDCPNLMSFTYESTYKPFDFVSSCYLTDFRYQLYMNRHWYSRQMNALHYLFGSPFAAMRNLNVVIALGPHQHVIVLKGLPEVALYLLRKKLAGSKPLVHMTLHSFEWTGIFPHHYPNVAHLVVYLISSRGSRFLMDVSDKLLSLHKSRNGRFANLCSLEKYEFNTIPNLPLEDHFNYRSDRIELKFDLS